METNLLLLFGGFTRSARLQGDQKAMNGAVIVSLVQLQGTVYEGFHLGQIGDQFRIVLGEGNGRPP